jgi:hypothetical protein
MASRKKETADALAPKGWQNQFGEKPAPASKHKGKLQRKTYLFNEELIRRLDATAKANNVGVNELVRYLVTHGLDELDTGIHTLPVRAVTIYTLDV